jgi:hypothetical protein
MKENRSLKLLAIVAIVVATVSLSVAYAAFSQTLNITGTATVKGGQWNIHYNTTSATATPSGQASNVTDSFSTTSTDFAFSANLVKPGDSIVYTVKIVNEGQIPAKLDSITQSSSVSTEGLGVSGDAANYITVELSGIAKDDVIAAGADQTITITVTYKNDVTTATTTDITASITGALNFVQA